MKVLASLLVILAVIFFISFYQKPKTQQQQDNLVVKSEAAEDKNAEIHSSDGTMNLIRRDNSFFVADISGKNERLIFTKTTGGEKEIILPLNSFSPDNKYLYLEEKTADRLNILVFKVSGQPFSGGEQYLDVGQLLAKNKGQFFINHVTGWVSPTLIQVNTLKDDLTRGPSYWFSVETRAFLLH